MGECGGEHPKSAAFFFPHPFSWFSFSDDIPPAFNSYTFAPTALISRIIKPTKKEIVSPELTSVGNHRPNV